MAVLEQRLADALSNAAVDLAMNNERVHRAPDAIDRGIIDECHIAGIRIDFHLADMRAIGIARLHHRFIASSGEPSGRSARSAAARATANSPTAWFVPFTAKRPLEKPISAAGVSKRVWGGGWDDYVSRMERRGRARPEWAPPPTVTRSVSPATTCTTSIGTPSHSVTS